MGQVWIEIDFVAGVRIGKRLTAEKDARFAKWVEQYAKEQKEKELNDGEGKDNSNHDGQWKIGNG